MATSERDVSGYGVIAIWVSGGLNVEKTVGHPHGITFHTSSTPPFHKIVENSNSDNVTDRGSMVVVPWKTKGREPSTRPPL